MTRRDWLRTAALGLAAARLRADPGSPGIVLNDMQSRLNECRVARVEKPTSLDALQAALHAAAKENLAVSVAGGRHAMGGQQFGAGTLHLDTRGLCEVRRFDRDAGRITVGGGIDWLQLLTYLEREQAGKPGPFWSWRQKQTGVDRVTVAGTVSANGHGRGLAFPPFASEVVSLVLVDGRGVARTCSRTENAELFSLACGGYGLFGVIAEATLQLVPRRTVERVVKRVAIRDMLDLIAARQRDGFTYGDCQYATDVTGDAPHEGIVSCYRPVDDSTPMPPNARGLTAGDWKKLYALAQTDKKAAFEAYSKYYLSTTGQVYHHDTAQLAGNLDYDELARMPIPGRPLGTEVITEVYVPRDKFMDFVTGAKRDCREHNIDLIYGTIRFIAADADSFLAWAKPDRVCVLCNLRVDHSPAGRAKAADDFRRLIGRAVALGGGYYLTYHRHATRAMVEQAYPRFVEFLKLQAKHDPAGRFQSDWSRQYRAMFADRL